MDRPLWYDTKYKQYIIGIQPSMFYGEVKLLFEDGRYANMPEIHLLDVIRIVEANRPMVDLLYG